MPRAAVSSCLPCSSRSCVCFPFSAQSLLPLRTRARTHARNATRRNATRRNATRRDALAARLCPAPVPTKVSLEEEEEEVLGLGWVLLWLFVKPLVCFEERRGDEEPFSRG